MTGWKERIFLIAVICMAFVCNVLCVWHYGLGIQPYYEEELEDPGKSVEGVYWLENGTVVEQLYSNSAAYMVGVDLILLETGEGREGTLYETFPLFKIHLNLCGIRFPKLLYHRHLQLPDDAEPSDLPEGGKPV